MKRYLPLALALFVVCLPSCLITRHSSERLGKFSEIRKGHPLVFDAAVRDYPTPWGLSFNTSTLTPDDSTTIKEFMSSNATISVYLENTGHVQLNATTFESLLRANAPDESVGFKLSPGEKVKLFKGSAADLIRSSRGIGFMSPSPLKWADRLNVRYYFEPDRDILLKSGKMIVNLKNSDSL